MRVPLAFLIESRGKKRVLGWLIVITGLLSVFLGLVGIPFGYILGGSLLYEYLVESSSPLLVQIAQTWFYNAYLMASRGVGFGIRFRLDLFQLAALVIMIYLYRGWKRRRCEKLKKELNKGEIMG